jgi:hypothetical protein
VTSLPPTMARANVEAELDAARAWASRHNWTIDWSPDELLLRAATYHKPVHRLVELTADVGGYRAEPPAWRVVELGTNEPTVDHFPAATPSAGIAGSVFHGNKLICAPWNRLAYQECNPSGPHGNWGGPTAWLQVGEGPRATELAEMLELIHAHLRQSTGFMP